eukprot:404002-Prymnesium_polylepis.1
MSTTELPRTGGPSIGLMWIQQMWIEQRVWIGQPRFECRAAVRWILPDTLDRTATVRVPSSGPLDSTRHIGSNSYDSSAEQRSVGFYQT